MNRKILIIFSVLIFLGLLIFWVSSEPKKPDISTVSSSPTPPTNPGIAQPVTAETERERQGAIWSGWLGTPIVFYGQVVDQDGTPVSGATVHVSITDTLGSGINNTKLDLITDSEGNFQVQGKGLGVVVMTSKQGYYKIKGSDGTFGYIKGGRYDPHTDPAKPAIFTLRKQGPTEFLISRATGGQLPKNGTPTFFNLETGTKQSEGPNTLKIECWVANEDLTANSDKKFDWKLQLTNTGGGIVEREGQFLFEAPGDGYEPAIEIAMLKESENWKRTFSKEYFVKTAAGNFARFQIRFNAGGQQTFVIQSFFNPKAGSRNLESNQTAKAR